MEFCNSYPISLVTQWQSYAAFYKTCTLELVLTPETPEQSFWLFSTLEIDFINNASKSIDTKYELNEIKINEDILSYTRKKHEQSNWLLVKLGRSI